MSPIPGARPPESAVSSDVGSEYREPVEVPPLEESGLTKIVESITETNPPDAVEANSTTAKRLGRPRRATTAPVTWSVRGVSREARAVFERGAAQAGKTLGQYLNEDVQALVVQHLEAPATAEANLQSEIQYLRRLVENLTVMMGGGGLLTNPVTPCQLPEPGAPPEPSPNKLD